MSKLFLVCITVVVIAVLIEAGETAREIIRTDAQLQVQMFEYYTKSHMGGVEVRPKL